MKPPAKNYTNPVYSIGAMRVVNGAKIKSNTGNHPGLWSAGSLIIDDSNLETIGTANAIWIERKLEISGDSVANASTGSAGVGIGSASDVVISGKPQAHIEGGWGMWNPNGSVKINGGVEAYGSVRAIENEPNLSGYANAAIYAGESKPQPQAMPADLSTDYHKEHYVRIQPGMGESARGGAAGIPETGDGAKLMLWATLPGLSAVGMTILLRKARKSF